MFISKRRLLLKMANMEMRMSNLDKEIRNLQDVYDLDGTFQVKTLLPESPLSRSQISFEMPTTNWSKMKASQEWKAFAHFLEEYQIHNIHLN